MQHLDSWWVYIEAVLSAKNALSCMVIKFMQLYGNKMYAALSMYWIEPRCIHKAKL